MAKKKQKARNNTKHRSNNDLSHLTQDNGPTPERVRKDDYEFLAGKLRRSETLKVLERSGEISSKEVSAAMRWLTDYIFANEGYSDALKGPLSEEAIKSIKEYGYGDQATFNLSRAKAGIRISDVRRALGLCTHMRLVDMLIDKMSFTSLGLKYYPDIYPKRAREKASTQCALILEQLAEYYEPKEKFHEL